MLIFSLQYPTELNFRIQLRQQIDHSYREQYLEQSHTINSIDFDSAILH